MGYFFIGGVDYYPSDTERAEVQAIFKQARKKYTAIARIAEQSWGDS